MIFHFPVKFDCDTIEALFAAFWHRKGASHDYSSTTDDRGHAGTESVTAYTGIVSATGIAIRTLLLRLAECFDPRAHPGLSDLPHEREEVGHQLDTYSCFCASVPLQGYTQKKWAFEEDIPLPKKPQKLPVILSPEEVLHFLGCVERDKHRVILTTCYAAGLRISEAVRLKATAIDSARMVIRVEQGKGRKDRYVMLSPKLLEILRSYWRAVRPKQWLFPGRRDDRPITKDAVEAACRKAHRLSGLSKPVTPHSLRHAFAVHLLESGTAEVRSIQLLLGHRSLATTTRYLHIATSKICATSSPLDLLPRPVPAEPPPAPPNHF